CSSITTGSSRTLLDKISQPYGSNFTKYFSCLFCVAVCIALSSTEHALNKCNISVSNSFMKFAFSLTAGL
ncbi:hypothetical protein L9F63_006328, partial [Diploptera punctata]